MIRRALVTLLIALASVSAVPPASAAGTWIAEVRVPTLRQRGWHYRSARLGSPPETAAVDAHVTRVLWRYHYQTWYPGLRVILCAAGTCIDATAERGWSNAFRGLPATTAFRFHFVVAGYGMLTTPMRGGQVQLLVSYE